ncbi:MAG TPA: aldehyde dehydrogenase [Pseudonocardia sp.]|nr:aldehyde dehydrogenase [Pseudonocardia sp.]
MTTLLSREITVDDPRTGEPVSRVPVATEERCAEAVRAARAAAPGWARTPAAERGAALHAAAEAVRAAADELAELNTRETGKLRDDSRGGVDAGIGTLVQYAELGPVHRGRTLHGGWAAADLMVPEPRGVVAVITPWNDPVAIAAGLIGAALATGNTVVHKPSERCPATGRRFAELLAAHLPAGVLEIVDGDGPVGAALAGAAVDVVAHVGGSAAGRAIAQAGARTGAHVLRENGGNDALIVDAGVDPVWAAAQAALGSFANAGQICVSVERVLVHEGVAGTFLAALEREAAKWAERIGPLVDRRHREHVHGHVEAARRAGAEVRAGGAVPDGPGAFYPPTVLAGVTADTDVWREETFGPVAPVRVVADFGAALGAAADDDHGLAATVLTADMAHAQRAWRELPVGTVKVNDVFGGAPGGAAQPRRRSGSGYGYGPELLDEMTTTKVVHLAPPPR